MSLTFRPNRSIEEQLERHPGLIDEFRERAESIAEEARHRAPVDTGEFRASIHVEAGIAGIVRGRVISDDDKAKYLEYGTIDTPTFSTLRNAAEIVIGL